MSGGKMTGKEAEQFVAEYLAKRGYFVGDFNKGNSGEQPFDQIAIGSKFILAYDVKHCNTDYFPLDRVRENQINALSYLDSLNNERIRTSIILVYEKELFVLPFYIFTILKNSNEKSIKPTDMLNFTYYSIFNMEGN